MPITRRTFIKFLSAACLLWHPGRMFAQPPPENSASILAAFLDTLMPADETPAATDLNIDRILLKKAETDSRYNKLLQDGCLWLEKMALIKFSTGFALLEERQRIRLVEIMEQSRKRSLPRVFFDRIRRDLFEHYYSQPASWGGLGIDRPPQPYGYPDYHRPPTIHS